MACDTVAGHWGQALFLLPRGSDPLGQMRRFMTEAANQA
jgi:hypothetical protein